MGPTVTELWKEYGCSVIPVGLNKRPAWQLLPQVWDESTKRNKPTWKPFQSRSPSQQEIEAWSKAQPPAFAIVTGKISGRITFDFDGEAGIKLAEEWKHSPASAVRQRRTSSGRRLSGLVSTHSKREGRRGAWTTISRTRHQRRRWLLHRFGQKRERSV
jgi:hypothetical protein